MAQQLNAATRLRAAKASAAQVNQLTKAFKGVTSDDLASDAWVDNNMDAIYEAGGGPRRQPSRYP